MENRKTILILHGWQSSKEKWQKVKEGLEKQGMKVILPDLPGFKLENKLDTAWNLDDYVRWTRNFVDREMPKEKFFLLGQSFGGRVAIKFAVQHPEKLEGLILVSAAGIKTKFHLIAGWKLLGFLKTLSFLPGYNFLRKVFYFKVLKRTDYYMAEGTMKDVFLKAINEDLSLLLPEIKIPTAIIWGKKDFTTPLRDAYFMKGKISHSRLFLLENIGHTPHLENPELLAQKIIEFIKTN